jgi:hypothetical protein
MTGNEKKQPVAWYVWPFYAIWKLVLGIFALTGRLVGAVVGFVLLIAGIVVSLTVVGAIVGIPMIIVGFLLVVRSIF